MQENEFEKKVQQQMQDFNLRPSDEVWKEVERRIRKEKKRRFIFWWFLLFVLVAGGIGAGILFSNKKEKLAVRSVIEKEQPAKSKAVAGDSNVQEKAPSATDAVVNENADTTAVAITTGKKNNENINAIPPSGERKMASLQGEQVIESGKGGVKKKKTKQQDHPVAVQPARDEQSKTEIEPGIDPAVTETQIVPPVAVMPVADEIAIVQTQEPKQQTLSEKVPPPADTVNKTAKNKKEKKNSKWKSDISLSLGRSGMVDGFGLFKSYGNASADMLASAPGLAIYSTTPVYYSSSAGIRLNGRRPLSQKLELGLGLGYNYLSNKIMVGNRVDSARNVNNLFSGALVVDNYYRLPGNSSNTAYHNRYHFVSLSADLSWRIINGKKFKLDWKNGVQYSRLFSSSMLHYDRNLPGYYKDNRLLNKNQVFITTGFSIPVTDRLRINPFINYSLTPILNVNDAGNTHYTDFGIRVNFQLNKK